MCKRFGWIAALTLLAVMLLISGLFPLRRSDAFSGTSSGERTAAQAELPHGVVDVNTADEEELRELYGIGETLAAAIISEREARGAFHYPEDLIAVRGIGAKTLAKFYDMLDFPER